MLRTTSLLFLVSMTGSLTVASKPAERLEAFRTANGLTAIVAGAWQGDTPLFREVVGSSQVGVPAELNMKFRAGGVCLTSLTAVFLQTVDEGLVGMDDPINQWLPDLPNADRVTLRMLANCTSGYADYIANNDFLEIFTDDPFYSFTPQEIIGFSLDDGQLYEPGEGWAYSHSTFVMLGLILEKVHGKPVSSLLEERIFQPLQLADTEYTENTAMSQPILHAFTTERGVLEETTFWNPSWTSFTGSMASTLDDVSLIIRAVGRGTLFSPAAREALTAPTTVGLGPNTNDRYYGLGIGVVEGSLLQNPNMAGYQGIVHYDPETDTTLVAYTTQGGESDPDTHHGMKILPLMKELAAKVAE